MAELKDVPRRKRRFYRDQDTKLIKHLSKHVQKANGIKEIEKQRIILSLKKKLEQAEKQELKRLAVHLFEEESNGKDETKEVVFNEVLKHQGRKKELSNKDADEIAESIYSQLKEKQEAQMIYDKLEEKRLRKEKKDKSLREKRLFEKRAGMRGRKRRDTKELGVLGLDEPAMVKKKDSASEVENIKDELSLELGLNKAKEQAPGREDDPFKELEDLNEENDIDDEPGDDEFSMEGFTTDLGAKKRKKKF